MNYASLVVLTSVFACWTTETFSQDKFAESILPVNMEWSEGSIMTNDGTELTGGLLRYNHKGGLLSYKNGDDDRTFTARGVAGFEFFDERIQKQRVFYSFLYEDAQEIERPMFFEVVLEFKDFAILSKVDPIDIEHKSVGSPGNYNPATNTITQGSYYGTSIEISQTETIFLMNTKGSIRPYVRIVETEVDGVFFDRTSTKNKMIDNKLLKEFVGQQMNDTLVAFAKEKGLSFKRKDDLIEIFNYYEQLIE